ncbi:hypothetical protein F5X96DRAFT_673609 [Biscogniauxia mediterranea]|nr:hypothetical protein F5X96DRAFT_673609 [Biscogniauxia mediterranea]
MPSATMKLSRASPSSPYYSTTTTTTTTSATSASASASASLLSSSSSSPSTSPSTRIPYSSSSSSSSSSSLSSKPSHPSYPPSYSPYPRSSHPSSHPSSSYPPSSYSSPYITSPHLTTSTSSSSPASALLRWARLKKYRIEVTYGVYVYTPVEKLIFWVLFCVLFVAVGGAALLWVARQVAFLLALVGDGGEQGKEEVGEMLMRLGTTAVEAGAAPVSTAEGVGVVVAGRV